MDRIYLVPGFFGFANLGDLRYFGHVVPLLRDHGEVEVVSTHPTASLTARARILHDAIAASSKPGDRVHLVGHSSGGLDARLFVAPGAKLGNGLDPSAIAERVRTVVTVASPHRGTPSAEVFTTVAGKALLRALSLMTIVVLRRGGLPLQVVLQVSELLVSSEKLLASDPKMLDEVFSGLLGELSPERRRQVETFFTAMGADQGLLPQLMPDAMTLFGATTADRPGVRYGSVVTRARRPGMVGVASAGLSPVGQAGFAWFTLCWGLASRFGDPELDPTLRQALAERYPGLGPADNDGMVPTLSQPWGELIRAVDADHLDVIGHFGDRSTDPPHHDWFTTGTGYDRNAFEATWIDIAQFFAT
ncbi:MAG: triacylglycerol lipase [Myxococcales bacterium]|nr:triacylglycerol lipase [Myxococcales bacterium]